MHLDFFEIHFTLIISFKNNELILFLIDYNLVLLS